MKRTNHITIRLSDIELEKIVKKANAQGVTRSAYIRNCLVKDIESDIIEVNVVL
jgi:predicted DNA binding CopG/RHH family protein